MNQNKFSKSSFAGAALGTMIEYYDYAALGIFLPIIAPIIFAANSPYDALVKGYYALLIAMVARPLGGLAFGIIGDSIGRKNALLLSMYGIAVSTLVIGLIPPYATIGVWAGIILVAAKAAQVFCFGGEYNGAGVFVVEHAPKHQEGFIGSLLTSTMLMGSLLATLFGVVMTADGMPDWSWRLAFIIGGLIGILGVFYRKSLIESPNFVAADLKEHKLKFLLKSHPYQLLAGVFIGGFATLPFTTVLTFINPVLMTKGYFTAQQLMMLQSALIAVAIITLIIAGKLADLTSPQRIMKAGCLLLVIFAYPLMLIIEQKIFIPLILAQSALIICNELLLGPSNACLKNFFPMQYRYRACSLSFTLGMSVIGGITPIVENALYRHYGTMSAVSIWLIIVALATYISIKLATHNPNIQKLNLKTQIVS